MGRQTFTWKTDTLSGNVAKLPSKVQRAVIGATEFGATKATAYGKQNAKWIDRTGNARQGFRAYAVHEIGKSTVVIAHGMSYGIWLEVRFSGRYAIVNPTMQYTGELVMRLLADLFKGSIKGSV